MVYLSTDTNTMQHGFSRLKSLKILDSSNKSIISFILKYTLNRAESGIYPKFTKHYVVCKKTPQTQSLRCVISFKE